MPGSPVGGGLLATERARPRLLVLHRSHHAGAERVRRGGFPSRDRPGRLVQHFPTRARARITVADYIEVFYNPQRLHSTLGYCTPFEALTDHPRRGRS